MPPNVSRRCEPEITSGNCKRLTVDAFEPSDAHWTDDERVDVLAHRWWTLQELLTTDESYEPAELVNLVRRQLPSC